MKPTMKSRKTGPSLSLALATFFFQYSVYAAPSAAAPETPDCSRMAGDRPHLELRPGFFDPKNPIQHIIVITQENHSFDNYLGQLNRPEFYGSEIDGTAPQWSNWLPGNQRLYPYHETNLCPLDPKHDWYPMHAGWNGGKNDLFAAISGNQVMGYYDNTDLPFIYSLANTFTVGDRYFAPLLGPTYPNRYFLMAGTSHGEVKNDNLKILFGGLPINNIFAQLSRYGVSWKYYKDGPNLLLAFQETFFKNLDKMGDISDFETDVVRGQLPQVIFLDPNDSSQSEHPTELKAESPVNIQTGQFWLQSRILSIMLSPYWKNSIIFVTYDENGGYADHVAPPKACRPDKMDPKLKTARPEEKFEYYGLRVPFIAVSPYVKRHYVTHQVYDHTSILRFIEDKFNLPFLTNRDANANGFSDILQFDKVDFNMPQMKFGHLDSSRSCDSRVTKLPK